MSSISEKQVEIWHIPTITDATIARHLTLLLSAAEQQRAQQTHSVIQKNSYITSHAAMRIILGKHLQQPPKAVEFTFSEQGKPHIKNDSHLFFNLSHTSSYALLGISRTCRIGIDIETIKPSRDILAIAKRFFSEYEYSWLTATNAEQRIECFYQLWCHKEAYLKAIGLGLQGGLSKFSLSRQELQHGASIIDGENQQWWLQTVKTPEKFRAAIAIDCSEVIPAIHHWQFNQHSGNAL